MIKEQDLIKIKEYSMNLHERDDLHGWGHVLRVLRNARKIHEFEGGNWNTIEAMVWLHDTGRKQEKEENIHHALLSAKNAREIMNNLELNDSLIEKIISGIKSHSFSIGGHPKTLEAKILSDADKLDALGAVGIFRAAAYQHDDKTGLQGMLEHFDEKLLHLDEKLFLDVSKRIAQVRISRLEDFKENLKEELEMG